jgi:hypothetical protein
MLGPRALFPGVRQAKPPLDLLVSVIYNPETEPALASEETRRKQTYTLQAFLGSQLTFSKPWGIHKEPPLLVQRMYWVSLGARNSIFLDKAHTPKLWPPKYVCMTRTGLSWTLTPARMVVVGDCVASRHTRVSSNKGRR